MNVIKNLKIIKQNEHFFHKNLQVKTDLGGSSAFLPWLKNNDMK